MPSLHLDRQALHACWDEIADSGMFTEGKYVALLEQAVEEWSGMHAVAVSSAGSGLFALGHLLGVKGHGVMVPANTFYATGAMMDEAGGILTLVDCNRHDFSMSAGALGRMLLTTPMKRGQTVVLTHVGGGLARDYRTIAEMCDRLGVNLVEDAAHALGTGGDGKLCAGKLGKAAVFSLYPTKAIPAGEGGVVVTRDDALARELRIFRNYGKVQTAAGIVYQRGFNLRMDEWTAAVAWLQFQKRHAIHEERAATAARLAKIAPCLIDWSEDETNWYKFPVSSTYPATMQAGKIYGLSDQLSRSLVGRAVIPALPNADWVAANHICLPVEADLYKGMTTAEIDKFLRGANA